MRQTNYTSYTQRSPNTSSIYDRDRRQSSVYYPHSPQAPSKTETKIRGEVLNRQSNIEYVPFEKKVIDYVDEAHYSLVPRKRIMTDYRDEVRVDIVPREVSVTDYYAVEHIRRYIPEIIPMKAT